MESYHYEVAENTKFTAPKAEFGPEAEAKFIDRVKLELESLEVEGVKLNTAKFNHSV